MNINIELTDTELQKLLLAANYLDMDTNVVVRNLLVRAVEDLLDDIDKCVKLDTENETLPKTKKIPKGIGSDNNAGRNLVNKGFVNKPMLGAAIRSEDIPKFKKMLNKHK